MHTRIAGASMMLALCLGAACPVVAGTLRFAVLSDLHYFDPDLGTNGAAFEAYQDQDRKMFREGPALLDAAIGMILDRGVDFVLVSGDLTKDGERASHEKCARKLATLAQQDVPVYVVPGNHDILNPRAMSYAGDTATPVPTVTPLEFSQIYGDCGYSAATERDAETLSYTARPGSGMLLIGLDTCRYPENASAQYPVTGGRLSQNSLAWAMRQAQAAQAAGLQVIGLAHHGLVEHFQGQSSVFPDYVLDDWSVVSRQLAEAGLRLVFTGHFHASDITRHVWTQAGDTPHLTDVETGSLVTFPCPVRFVTLYDDGRVDIRTEPVTAIDLPTGGLPFPLYARQFLEQGARTISTGILTDPPAQGGLGLSPGSPLVSAITAQAVDVVIAHYSGDELPATANRAFYQALERLPNGLAQWLGNSLEDVWTDLAPADRNVGFRTAPFRRFVTTLGAGNPTVPLDIDLYTLSGQQAEPITVRVEPITPVAAGGHVILAVLSANQPLRLLGASVGGLPRELTLPLPTAACRIAVVQYPDPNLAFSGRYSVDLWASETTRASFTPTTWVE